jgi:hypothetical protein
MLSVLQKVIDNELVGLMRRKNEWSSVHVTYHPPEVERLWIQVGPVRVFLHRIHPCAEGEALFHPHPWPSAVRVVSGEYAHTTGYCERLRNSERHPYELMTSILRAGSDYEMIKPMAWHSVRPLGGPSDSIMIVGEPHKVPIIMPSPPTEKQGPLSPERFDELFAEWHDRIDKPVECHTCGWEGRHSDLACFEDEGGNPIEQRYARCPKCMDEDQVGSKNLTYEREWR